MTTQISSYFDCIMVKYWKGLFLVSCLILLQVWTTEALYCVQCNTWETPDCISGRLEPTKCQDSSAIACETYSGLLPIGKMVTRSCVSEPKPSRCRSLVNDDDLDNNYEFCISSCFRSGCNGIPVKSSRRHIKLQDILNAIKK